MQVRFDRFTFDSDQRLLLDGDATIHLGPKAFQLLANLLRESPRALSKAELYEAIWPDTIVEETNLAGLVNELRAALGDTARKPRFIRTLHGFGYAFCGELRGDVSLHEATVMFRGRAFPLQDGVNILGRDRSADVWIDDGTVSRTHASITISENVVLEDLQSKNGTFVDGERLKKSVALQDGQVFVLGDASITFRRTRGGSTVTIHHRG